MKQDSLWHPGKSEKTGNLKLGHGMKFPDRKEIGAAGIIHTLDGVD
jgi:hypothetical protein